MGNDDQADKTRLPSRWQTIVSTTEGLAFNRYLRFMELIFRGDRSLPLAGKDAYRVLQVATEAFVMVNCGVIGPLRTFDGGSDREDLTRSDLPFPTNGLDEVFAEAGPARIPGGEWAYPEPWMDRVDAMKKLQGWTDTSVLHFRNLGVFGEQILLGIRWGSWGDVRPSQAANWARFFRPQIQGYVHAYQGAAGIHL
jgi:hypothetical protein